MNKIILLVLPFAIFTACSTTHVTKQSSVNMDSKLLLADGRSSVSTMKKDVDLNINGILLKLEGKQNLESSALVGLIESIQTLRNYGSDITVKSKLKINAIINYLTEIGFNEVSILEELKTITNTSQMRFS